MEDKEKEILVKSLEIFFRYGIRSISMDEISSRIGISKKTLYKYVSNKSDLINKTVALFIQGEEQMCDSFMKQGGNAMDVLTNIFKKNFEHVGEMNPTLVYDMKKYYGQAWQKMENHKRHFIFNNILENIEQGQKEGLYRSDLNSEIIAWLYTARIDTMLDPDLFPKHTYSYKELMAELLIYHLRGIATKAGIDYLENHIKLNF